MFGENLDCPANRSAIPEFHLRGFQISPILKPFIFILLLVTYMFTIAGNFLIITIVLSHERLHTPMYLFLSSLSFLEICYTTSTIYTMLGSLLPSGKTLTFSGCLAQLNIFAWLAMTECFLLTAMSYDRYLAICYPLHYATLMTLRHCLKIIPCIWVTSCVPTSFICILLSTLQFSDYNEIDHFFCDVMPLLTAACSDTSIMKIMFFIVSCTFTPLPFLIIIASYTYVIATILRIPSTTGRHRAFSTCSSHIIVVIMYFGTLITMYVVPATGQSLNVSKALALLYTVATPLFNPIIYTLRNKDIREITSHFLKETICVTTS